MSLIGTRLAATENHAVWLDHRKDVKSHLCGSANSKDSNVRQALIDRLGPPGTKKKPGATYGMRGDLWQALALAETAYG